MKTIKVTTQEVLDKCLALRKKVFVQEQGVDESIEADYLDTLDNPNVQHFAYTLADHYVIATCRVKHISSNTIQIGRFAVDMRVRNIGIGSRFLRQVENYYYDLKVESIFVHAQISAMNFYQSLGYKTQGQPYLEANIEHINMSKSLFQDFYSRFSLIYSDIFPLKGAKKEFIESFIQDKEELLDIGCATGDVLALIKEHNKNALGIDINSKMISIAKQKGLEAVELDMRFIDMFDEQFDGIINIGNTLVHLKSTEDIQQFFHNTYACLKPQGECLIQILNYDFIYKHKITQLPKLTSKDRSSSLERSLILKENVKFQTLLNINNHKYTSTVNLIPLKPQELFDFAIKAGLEIKECYGDFNKSEFDDLSENLIVILKKSS